MATALPTEPRFDPEYYQVPDELRLVDVTAELRRAQRAIDHLRKERGEARALAARFEREMAEQKAHYVRTVNHVETRRWGKVDAENREMIARLLRNDAVGRDCTECNGRGGFEDDRRDEWIECEAADCYDGRCEK
jgi:hypothetical protein